MAAEQLAAAGVEVQVRESRDRIGGRVWTQTLHNGAPVEMGAEFVTQGYELLPATVERLGLSLAPMGMSFSRREPRGGIGTTDDALETAWRAAESAIAERGGGGPVGRRGAGRPGHRRGRPRAAGLPDRRLLRTVGGPDRRLGRARRGAPVRAGRGAAHGRRQRPDRRRAGRVPRRPHVRAGAVDPPRPGGRQRRRRGAGRCVRADRAGARAARHRVRPAAARLEGRPRSTGWSTATRPSCSCR